MALRTAGLALVSSAFLGGAAAQTTRTYDWTVTYQHLQADSHNDKSVIMVNGKWPPEAIEVQVNDVIQVSVKNDKEKGLSEGISLHAHGFHQTNNNPMDGPVGVTQCEVLKGSSQTYSWNADQPGTFWVHSHKASQYPWGLRAPLIVRDSSEPGYYGYDAGADFVMDLADSYNQTMADVDAKYQSAACCYTGGNPTEVCGLAVPPDSAMVRDDFSGSTEYDASSVAINGKMRVRLINMSAASSFIVFSENEKVELRVIELDGVPLKNAKLVNAKSVVVHPGQRYSLLINNPGKNFLLHAVVDPTQWDDNSCQTLYSYSTDTQWNYAQMATARFNVGKGDMPKAHFTPNNYCTDATRPCYTKQNITSTAPSLQNLPSWAIDNTKRVTDEWFSETGSLAPRHDEERIRYGTDSDSTIIRIEMSAANGTNRWANMNSKAFKAPGVPVILRQAQPAGTCANSNLIPQPGRGQSVESYYGANNTYHVKQNTNVFFVINDDTGPNQHPFHLHGYDFQVLYQSAEEPSDDDIKRNSLSMPSLPVRRDTMMITSQNYTVIAIHATNPGSWIFHCHNDFHLQTGMGGALVVDGADSDGWKVSDVGQQVWNQCGFKTESGGGFQDWTKICCANTNSCRAGPEVTRQGV